MKKISPFNKLTKQKIIIVGCTSAIARATAAQLASQGHSLYLIGRDKEETKRICTDLFIRYNNPIQHGYVDIESLDSHQACFDNAINALNGIDGVIFAIGYMGEDINKLLSINYNCAVNFLEICATYFEQKKHGFIIAISSVAGDRGRQSNYIYGSAKGGLTIYLQGLRNRLFKSNINVVTIKPGFVDTPMTFGLPKLFLVASPETVGKAIAKTIFKKTNVAYIPWFWRYIMLIIKLIPETIFKRLSL